MKDSDSVKDIPVVINFTSVLYTLAMIMMMLPFKLLNMKIKDYKFIMSKKDLRHHLYGDGFYGESHPAPHNALKV